MYLSMYSAVKLTLMGTFFNSCLPGATGGDAIKIYYAIEGNQGRRTEIATIVLLDRAIGMFALLVLPLVLIPLISKLYVQIKFLRTLLLIIGVIAAAMVVAIVACCISHPRNSRFLSAAFDKLPLGHYAERMFDAIHAYRYKPVTLLTAVGISLLAHTMNLGAALLLAKATRSVGIAWEMIVLVPLGLLANSLPVTPGGLGVGEAAFNELFAMAGLSGGAAILLGLRFLLILSGLIGLAFYLQGRKRFVHETFFHFGHQKETSSH
jgi:uncharacterized protein (TIRG00374 family)